MIGRPCKDVPAARAADVVLGYTVANDVSARDQQRHDGQWTRAKGHDTFCPLGPWIETGLDPPRSGHRTEVDGRYAAQQHFAAAARHSDASSNGFGGDDAAARRSSSSPAPPKVSVRSRRRDRERHHRGHRHPHQPRGRQALTLRSNRGGLACRSPFPASTQVSHDRKFASVSARRRPEPRTSGWSAPRCSTGRTPDTTVARSCSASRTPMPPVTARSRTRRSSTRCAGSA